MNRTQRRCCQIATLLLASVALLSLATPALAQPQSGAVSEESWVTSYALVILCVGLGLFVICRPSRREKKVKKEKKD